MVSPPPAVPLDGVSVSIETWPGPPPPVPADEALTRRPVAGEREAHASPSGRTEPDAATTPGPPDRAAASDVPGVEYPAMPIATTLARSACSSSTWLRLEGRRVWGLRSAHLIPTFREHASGVGLDARGRAEPPQWPRALHRSGAADMAPMTRPYPEPDDAASSGESGIAPVGAATWTFSPQ